MQRKFLLEGSSISVVNFNEEFIVDDLPPRMYVVRYNKLSGFYLDIAGDELELPEKIYGNAERRVVKCIDTYNSRDAATGILLTGDKGTGKSLTLALIANKAVTDLGLPVLLVKEPFAGSQFESFIELIGECVLVFDEFGKMYASNSHRGDSEVLQSSLLSLLDGIDKTKRMVIMTENSELDINDFMLNRPSRIYYHFKYKKLDESSIRDFCEDKGVRVNITQDILDLSRRSSLFSFDMLQSIVEEHLRFDCEIEEAVDDLNIDLKESKVVMMDIVKVMDRATNEERQVVESNVAKPTSSNRYTYIKVRNNQAARTADIPQVEDENMQAMIDQLAGNIEEDSWEDIYVEQSDLAYEENGKLVYETDRYVFIAKEKPAPQVDYLRYLA